MKRLLTAAMVFLFAARAHATDYYVDPQGGSITNDGSQGSPWSTVQEVIEAGKLGTTVVGGDTIFLRSGYHGAIVIDGGAYTVPITITAESGQVPEVEHVAVRNASGIVMSGLSISPSHAPMYSTQTMVDIDGSSSEITVENCQVFSVADASGWTESDWVDIASSGFDVSGDNVTVRGNTVRNVRFGISVGGPHALIDHNTIDGFSADGLRGLGNYDVFQYNVVKNVYVGDPPDANHDDGFQSWSVGPGGVGTGEVVGIVLRGNFILNYEDPNQPFRTTLQGVGCFDGTFVDWVIENNVVITDHWHGITLLGARNCRIVNNTVLDVNTESPGPPWISIDAHKDGTPPENCIVRNNLATDFANAATGVTEDHNTIITDPFALFVDPNAHDVHLLPGVSVIDQGSSDLAPSIDKDGIARPQGLGFDLGAYEWHEADVVPVDGGLSTGGAAGSPAADGSASGGTTSGATGGAGNSGATGGAGAIAGGGTSGSGATTSSGGGTSAAGTSGSGATDAGNGETHAQRDEGGCGCRTTPDTRSSSTSAALPLLLAMTMFVRRRARATPGLGHT